MFDIESKYQIDTEIPVIDSNYSILHFDEIPILFSGTNSYGQTVISSIIQADEDDGIYRYLSVITKPDLYTKFLQRKISYLQLINTTKRVFITDKDDNGNTINIFELPLDLIDTKFLPLPSAYCPDIEKMYGSSFYFSLKGGLADIYEALADPVSNLTKEINKFLQTIADSASLLRPEVRQLAYSPASFRLNFKILLPRKNDLFTREDLFNKYVSSFISYSLNNLSSEIDNLLRNETSELFEEKVESPLRELYASYALNFNDEAKQRLKLNVFKVPFELEKIADNLGDGFEYLQIGSELVDKGEMPIGVIDNSFSEEIDQATEKISNGNNVTDTDKAYRNYTIRIYDLNTKTRKGSAYVKNVNDDTIDDSPRIKILGKSELNNTLFTESLHLNKRIEIRAKGRRENGKLRYLEIESE